MREDSPLAKKEWITAEDLVQIPVVAATSDIAQNTFGKWLGPQREKVDIIAKGNLLYNGAMFAQSNVVATIGIRLNCQYTGLKFLPFLPDLKTTTALVWKKEQVFSSATAAFLEFAKKYVLGIISNNR